LRLALRGGAFGMVGLMVVAAVAFGKSPASSLLHLGDGGAWLSNARKGSVTHVNGVAGKADAGVKLTGANGHRLKVVQDGTTIIVIDEVTGEISRIDASQINVAQSASYGAAGVDVVVGAGLAYVLDAAKGIVVRIDPHTLATVGVPLSLPRPLGRAGIDGQGTLWVPLPATGQVAPVRSGVEGTPVRVGSRHDVLLLTVAGGIPVATDATKATMAVLGGTGTSAGVQRTIDLPQAVTRSHGSALRVPPQTSGPLLPVAVTGAGQVVVTNVAGGSVSAVSLGGEAATDPLGEPQVEGARVYVPDEASGTVLVYDTAADPRTSEIPVSGQPGPIDLSVKDGLLWINDQNSAAAAVVNSAGQVHHVSKYATNVAGLHQPSQVAAAAPAQPSQPQSPSGSQGTPTTQGSGQGGNQGQGQGGGQGRGQGGSPSTTVPTTTIPATASTDTTTSSTSTSASTSTSSTTTTTLVPLQAPGSAAATSGAGLIDVSFTPASGRTPDHYSLVGAPSGATVTPAQVSPTGPFSFQVSGLDCGTQYSFQVASVDIGGATTTSAATAAVRPCVAPDAPSNLQLGTVEHGLNVSWSAPGNSGGASSLSYNVSWNGGSQNGLSGTSMSIGSLTNQNTYTVSVTAVSPAGTSTSAAVASATLTPPQQTYNNYDHTSLTVNVRSSPDTGAASLAQMPTVPAGSLGEAVTVYCQVTGGSYADPADAALHGNIWDKVNFRGTIGYAADIYVSTPNSLKFTFSDPPLWNCN